MPRRQTRRVTIVDVAKAAGISVSTVSRVVRDHIDVNEETRSRVQAAIDRLGYRPSPIARALVSGETRLLALLVSDITNPFYPELAKSIEQEAGKAGYTVVICNTGDAPGETRRHLRRLMGQGLDGVIHAATGRDEETALAVLGERRRIVFANRPPASDSVSYVVSDNTAGAAELTRHLLGTGHRIIGFVGGPSYAANANDRLRGFEHEMGQVAGTVAHVKHGDFSRGSGVQAVREWMDSGTEMTAIIGINDTVALGAMEEMVRRGLRLPADMALAGFDGTDFAASPVMSLTTVDQHSGEMGRRAVRLLLKQLASSQFVPAGVVLPTQLLVRASTEGFTRTELLAERRSNPSTVPFGIPATSASGA